MSGVFLGDRLLAAPFRRRHRADDHRTARAQAHFYKAAVFTGCAFVRASKCWRRGGDARATGTNSVHTNMHWAQAPCGARHRRRHRPKHDHACIRVRSAPIDRARRFTVSRSHIYSEAMFFYYAPATGPVLNIVSGACGAGFVL